MRGALHRRGGDGLKVFVYAIAKNEAAFADRWVDSMSEADGIVVLDTGSTDDTAARLRARGVTVVSGTVSPWRFDDARNASLALVPPEADLCVCTDLDEVFRPGWRQAAEAAWAPGVNQLRYRYTWNFNEDGSEGYVFYIEKIHARSGFRWVGAVHEVLRCPEPRTAEAPGIQLDHHADPTKSRAQYLPLLELAVREEPENDRNVHYLGREYLFRGRWDDAIRTLLRHLGLPSARWADERCASMRYLSRCYLEKGNRAEAERWLLRAAGEAPWLREPWLELAEQLARAGDWHGVCVAARRALAIRERPGTYVSEARAWGSLPYDLLSLGLYYTGSYRLAGEAVDQALRLEPENPRLLENRRFIYARLGPEPPEQENAPPG